MYNIQMSNKLPLHTSDFVSFILITWNKSWKVRLSDHGEIHVCTVELS